MAAPKKKNGLRKKPPGVKTKKPSTVRERKLKRRDKAATEAEEKAKDESQKSSVHWDGGRADQLLLRRAQRWQTNLTAEQASEAISPENRDKLPIKELAMVIVRKGLLNDDLRVNQHAVTNLLRAEQQNQADEHKTQPDKVDLTISESPEERVTGVLKRLEDEMARRGISLSGRKRPSPNGSRKLVK